jgi:hypothetical protein
MDGRAPRRHGTGAGDEAGLLLARARGRDLGFERPQKAPQRPKEGRWCVISLAVGLVANR